MKFITFLTMLVLSINVFADRKSIETNPLNLNISVEKNDFPIKVVGVTARLRCGGDDCFFGHCSTRMEYKELTGIEIKKVSENNQYDNYLISYDKREVLKNPYARLKDAGCDFRFEIKSIDTRYKDNYRPPTQDFVKGWASFEGENFADLNELENLSFKYNYTWTPNGSNEMMCDYKNPQLCSMFLNFFPVVNPKKLKTDLTSGQTAWIFPKP